MTDKSNTKTCHLTATGNIITPEGIIVSDKYLVKPDEGRKHQLEIVFEPGTDLTMLKNTMGKAALEITEDPTLAKNMVNKRILDPNNKPGDGKPLGPDFEGWILIRATSSVLPDFVHPNGKKCPESSLGSELYRGRWGRATLNPYALDTIDKKTGAKIKGVFIGLQNIQLLRHGKPIGFVKPEGENEFGAVEGAAEIESTVKSSANAGGESVDALFG
jgi:hypothetical protein